MRSIFSAFRAAEKLERRDVSHFLAPCGEGAGMGVVRDAARVSHWDPHPLTPPHKGEGRYRRRAFFSEFVSRRREGEA
jgi:hypothetical protein